jgi:hypothetical protein
MQVAVITKALTYSPQSLQWCGHYNKEMATATGMLHLTKFRTAHSGPQGAPSASQLITSVYELDHGKPIPTAVQGLLNNS